jgi:hypothetical protein
LGYLSKPAAIMYGIGPVRRIACALCTRRGTRRCRAARALVCVPACVCVCVCACVGVRCNVASGGREPSPAQTCAG